MDSRYFLSSTAPFNKNCCASNRFSWRRHFFYCFSPIKWILFEFIPFLFFVEPNKNWVRDKKQKKNGKFSQRRTHWNNKVEHFLVFQFILFEWQQIKEKAKFNVKANRNREKILVLGDIHFTHLFSVQLFRSFQKEMKMK